MSTTLARGLFPVRSRFDNGAVVIAQETSMTPAVTINLAFRAGSLFDPPELPGLSYLTGRLIDRGTAHRTASLIAETLDDRGVSLKVSTSRHTMFLSCTCLSEDFDHVLAMLAEIVREPTFPEAEIANRRAEALTTLRQREDNPASRALDAALALRYTTAHPYGRPAKGSIAGVERVTRSDMVAFHAARVRPSALTVVVVGHVPPARVVDRAAAELGTWTADLAERLDVPPSPSFSGRRVQQVPMPGKAQTDIAYVFSSVRRQDPRYYAYWMMNNILGQFGLGGRLADNIRERQGMAYYAFSTLDPAHGEAPLVIRAGVDPVNVDRAIAAIDHEVEALGANGPTATELDETRAYLIGSIPRLLETNESIATFLQSAEEFGLGLDFDRRLPASIEAVSIDDVKAAAVEVLDPARAVLGIAGPQQAAEPVEDVA